MGISGRISITGLRAFAYHGCTPQEKERGQNFLVDLELEYDISAAAREDRLEKAVDYDRLAASVRELVIRERYDLIETLAERIARHVLDATPASWVRVKVRKPEAPLSCEVAEVAVELTLRRHG